MSTSPLTIRDARPADHNFIYNSWLRSNRRARNAAQVPNDIYYTQHHKLVEDILARPTTRTYVITPTALGESDTICGYAVVEALPNAPAVHVVHYVYVKETFRRLGLAKQLLQHAGIPATRAENALALTFVTHLTSHAEPATIKYGLVFNPYLLVPSGTRTS